MRPRTTSRAIALLVIVAVAGAYGASPYLRAASFVVRAADLGGWVQRISNASTRRFAEAPLEIPTRYGPIRARLYRPEGRVDRTALLVSGIHPAGIAEPRLVGLARDLAASGLAIVTPDLPDLPRYRVTPQSTNFIEDAGVWLAGRRDLAPEGKIGLMGISFSGGLSIVAAGRSALRDQVAYVLSFGGHGDLRRVLRYLCTGIEPAVANASERGAAPRRRPPHDYAVAVVLFWLADRVVPREQVAALREALRTFLAASGLTVVDMGRAEAEFQRARVMGDALPEPSKTVMRHVNARDVEALGPRLTPYIALIGDDTSVSPERSPPPNAPVYLLHGADDNVIPAIESTLLARYLRSRTEVRYLRSRLITHAEVDRGAAVAEVWKLVGFWRALLAE